ncbi:tripartite tricarboxylate transporter TctB family protein [Nitratireductor sp. L15S-10]|uniref:tripartite tricarboxylate transporter TctB family protein n=1 Tax=Nitratireductor sp. L15S-10 TaxID=3034028 RepID=UPI0038573B2C
MIKTFKILGNGENHMPEKTPDGRAGPAFGAWMVVLAAIVVALAIGATALTLPPPISGRLRPGLVPGALAAIVLAAAVASLRRPGRATEQEAAAAPGLAPLLAAAAAVLILAFGTRTLGIAIAAFLASTVAAAGVTGVSPGRALRIGFGLAAGVSLLFALALRQPLPILPPGWWW